MGERQRTFSLRAFLALVSALSGMCLPVTGLGAHAAEHSPDAGAHPTWAAVHTLLGALFVVCATWHAALNRRAIVGHIRRGAGRLLPVSPEALCALALVGALVMVALGHGAVPR
jgi:hypothetical protein